jgi:hypothetical protein
MHIAIYMIGIRASQCQIEILPCCTPMIAISGTTKINLKLGMFKLELSKLEIGVFKLEMVNEKCPT